MSNPRDYLLELARNRGVSLAQLSEIIGKNTSYLQQFIRKGSPRKLGEQDRRILADFFKVAESKLGGLEEKSYNSSTPLPLERGWVDVPRLKRDTPSEKGRQNVKNGPEAAVDNFRFSQQWLRERGFEEKRLSVISVADDTMEPLLSAGDDVLIDRCPRPFRDGIYVIRLKGDFLVKRVASLGRGRLSLLNQNLAYPAIDVSVDDVEIIGHVVWRSGRL